MSADLDAIRQRRAAVPRPPWRWHGRKHGDIELVTAHSGLKRIVSTQNADPCDRWWELDPDHMCPTCRRWHQLQEIVEHPDDCAREIKTKRGTETCVDRFDADLSGASACDACSRYINAREEWDDERGPECEKPENWGTLWIGDPEQGYVRPINDFATKPHDHRDDIAAVVDHPIAEFLRRAPEDIDDLFAEVARLTAENAALRSAMDVLGSVLAAMGAIVGAGFVECRYPAAVTDAEAALIRQMVEAHW